MPIAVAHSTGTSSALFVPLPRRTIGDDVLDTLRKSIIAGAFASGDHIAEGTLAQQLGVSRAPVREAMMQLEREGLLVFNKRGAALVKEFISDLQRHKKARMELTAVVEGPNGKPAVEFSGSFVAVV